MKKISKIYFFTALTIASSFTIISCDNSDYSNQTNNSNQSSNERKIKIKSEIDKNFASFVTERITTLNHNFDFSNQDLLDIKNSIDKVETQDDGSIYLLEKSSIHGYEFNTEYRFNKINTTFNGTPVIASVNYKLNHNNPNSMNDNVFINSLMLHKEANGYIDADGELYFSSEIANPQVSKNLNSELVLNVPFISNNLYTSNNLTEISQLISIPNIIVSINSSKKWEFINIKNIISKYTNVSFNDRHDVFNFNQDYSIDSIIINSNIDVRQKLNINDLLIKTKNHITFPDLLLNGSGELSFKMNFLKAPLDLKINFKSNIDYKNINLMAYKNLISKQTANFPQDISLFMGELIKKGAGIELTDINLTINDKTITGNYIAKLNPEQEVTLYDIAKNSDAFINSIYYKANFNIPLDIAEPFGVNKSQATMFVQNMINNMEDAGLNGMLKMDNGHALYNFEIKNGLIFVNGHNIMTLKEFYNINIL